MAPDSSAHELLITPVPGALPIRARITKYLTSVGSAPGADIRLPTVSPQWAILQRDQSALLVRLLATGVTHALHPGGPEVAVDGVTLALPAPGAADDVASLPVQAIAEALCGAEGADDALRVMLRGIVAAARADVGAIVVSDASGYTVAVAEDNTGRPLPDAVALLSDTIVRQVLGSSAPLRLDDAAADERYARVSSVLALRLRSVLCVPMVLSGRVLGAFFLGRHDARRAFSERHAADLGVLATMALPLLAQLRRAGARPTGVAADHLIGECEAIRTVRRLVERVARSDVSVLVLGETGTGKEVAARAIHAASGRAARPMVAINCSAVPEGLFATELFGCRKGAFTGALADRKGRVEEADGSTLFLDEVGDMPLAMQASLLRVLELREVTRVGENTARPVNFRLVAATHKDLDAEVAAGRFREDLLFRLREITIVLPPLAARGGDIEVLAQLFLRQAEAQFGLPVHRLSEGALDVLYRYPWPGNVRELRAAMRRAALLADEMEIRPEDLQVDVTAATTGPGVAARPRHSAPPASQPPPPALDAAERGDDATAQDAAPLGSLERTLAEARDEFVARYIAAVLARHGGNRERAAAQLGISVRSLYRLG